MKLTRVKNTLQSNENEIISSRSFVEKFFSGYNEFNISQVSKIDPDDSDKLQNSSNFSLNESYPNPTIENDVKTGLVRKFEEFLENLNSDELQSNEDEILHRLTKLNDLRHNKFLEKDEKTIIITGKNLGKGAFHDMDVLKRKYENLLIENNELDLELINSNMKIREKKNEQLKGVLEMQRVANQLQAKEEELSTKLDFKKGKLIEMIKDMNEKENQSKKLLSQLNDTLISKEIIIKAKPSNEDKEKSIEVQQKRSVLSEITMKNEAISEQIIEKSKFLDGKCDLEEIQEEIKIIKEKIKGLEAFSYKVEKEIQKYIIQNKNERDICERELKKIENDIKNDGHHAILKEKYEDPMKILMIKKNSLQEEIKRNKKKFIDSLAEITKKTENNQESIQINKKKMQEINEVNTKQINELLVKKEILSENSKRSENLKNLKRNEINELDDILKELKENEKNENLSFLKKKSEILENLKELKISLENTKFVNLKLKADLENLRKGLFLTTNNKNLNDKKALIEDLIKKISLFKELRNEISDQINNYHLKIDEKTKIMLEEHDINEALSSKLDNYNKEIAKYKEDITKCTQDNDEVCGKFRLQTEENTNRETELKNTVEIMEKFKSLTENQMNEISKFNEKNNIYFKEISILEKCNIKEWNNYLKEKEKAKKKKK